MTTGESTAEPLSAVDTAWLHMEDPTNLMMVTGVLVFERPLDFRRVTELLRDRLLPIPRFTQRVVEPRMPFAGPRWETDAHFDLRSHFHRVSLRPPGDDAALRELVSDLMSTPLDYSKPLWQYHLIEGVGDGSALLCRIHHSIGDGIALVRVLVSMADGAEEAHDAGEPHEPHGWERLGPLLRPAARAISRTLEVTGTLMHEGTEALAHPERLLELASRGASGVDALARLLLMEPDPATPFEGLGNFKRAAWSRPIPLEDVKAAGKALGATVNDVLLAVTGALRRYLESHGSPAAGLEFRAVVPVNLRPKGAEHELGNRFGLVFLPLPVGIQNPVERLFELKERMDEIKRSPEALPPRTVLRDVHEDVDDMSDVARAVEERRRSDERPPVATARPPPEADDRLRRPLSGERSATRELADRKGATVLIQDLEPSDDLFGGGSLHILAGSESRHPGRRIVGVD